MNDMNRLIHENVSCLIQGINVITRLDNHVYARNEHTFFKSGVGKHFRHILDFYHCFLDNDAGRIDYDARGRDAKVERDKETAIQTASQTIDRLKILPDIMPDTRVLLCSRNVQSDDSSVPWTASNPLRELSFLSSHTIHHYAVISILLSIQGFVPPEEFGIAPSTLAYEKSRKA